METLWVVWMDDQWVAGRVGGRAVTMECLLVTWMDGKLVGGRAVTMAWLQVGYLADL